MVNVLVLETWLAYTPRRFFSLWCRFDRAHGDHNRERRKRLLQAMARVMLIAYPMNHYWADQDVQAWLSERALHASIEEGWHQALWFAGEARRAGDIDGARKFLEAARWRRTERLAAGRLRAILAA